MNLSVLYRGPLASCTYACPYCPFAKRRDDADHLAADRAALARFTGWIAECRDVEWSILFTPWGEALSRRWYRDAMVELSGLAHVRLVAAQTNLSHRVDWTGAGVAGRLALWCTYHPGETSLERFIGRCRDLDRHGTAHSVGVVGWPDHLGPARRLRAALPATTYVWINPADGIARPYRDDEIAAWSAIDPLFPLALRPHRSIGAACRTGETVISVDGAGDIRRCHFVPEVIGSIHDDRWRDALGPRPCPKLTCDCFIGYVHRDHQLYDPLFGTSLLSRIPVQLARTR
jgi:hypothetical protein